MQRSLKRGTAAACMLAAVPAMAFAATPTAGGKYTGKSATGKSVVIKVSKSGKSGKFTYCGDKQGVAFKIKDGKFTATLSVQGPGTVFKATGKFTSAKKVSGKIKTILTCDGTPAKYSAKLK
jgi:hypothetical protein